MELSNEEKLSITKYVSSRVGKSFNDWNQVDPNWIVNAFVGAIEPFFKAINSDSLLINSKKEWTAFIQADKDRAIAMNNMIQGNGNNELLESRYRAACYQWEDHRKTFIQTAKERTGKDPVWDFEGCTLSNGEKYEY